MTSRIEQLTNARLPGEPIATATGPVPYATRLQAEAARVRRGRYYYKVEVEPYGMGRVALMGWIRGGSGIVGDGGPM